MGLIWGFFDFWGFSFLCFWFCLLSKTLKTHQNNGFRSRGPSKNARGYRFHAYKWSNHHITSIIDIVFMFSLENHDRKIWEKNAKFMKKHKIQNIAATALGPSSKDRSRSEDSGSYTNISVRPLSVELWRFEVSIRISVPMLYITFL